MLHGLGLSLFVLFLFLGLSALLWGLRHNLARKWEVHPSRFRWICGALAAVALGLSGFVYWSEQNLASTTLAETVVESEDDSGLLPREEIRRLGFFVERPGLPHRLFLGPRIGSMILADHEVGITVSLAGPGGTGILDTLVAFPPGRSRSGSVEVPEWDGVYLDFTPVQPGGYTLSLNHLYGPVAALLIRVADPGKRDGRRGEGF